MEGVCHGLATTKFATLWMTSYAVKETVDHYILINNSFCFMHRSPESPSRQPLETLCYTLPTVKEIKWEFTPGQCER